MYSNVLILKKSFPKLWIINQNTHLMEFRRNGVTKSLPQKTGMTSQFLTFLWPWSLTDDHGVSHGQSLNHTTNHWVSHEVGLGVPHGVSRGVGNEVDNALGLGFWNGVSHVFDQGVVGWSKVTLCVKILKWHSPTDRLNARGRYIELKTSYATLLKPILKAGLQI